MQKMIAAIALFVSTSACAQYSGADLQRDIQSKDREKNIAAIYYVGGVVDQTAMISLMLKLTSSSYDKTMFFCLPETAKLGDVYAVVTYMP